MGVARWVGRAVGLDVHREFCVVAICEDGVTSSAGRVPSTPEGITALARSLLPSDRVALEVTGSCWEVARILEPHVNRVVVVSPDDTGIASARAKTDRLDARALAQLLWKGELEAVWMPDERCRVLRRRLARREQLVRSRSRSRTRSTRVWRAGCSQSRRALTYSASRAAYGSPDWSCLWRSASRSTRRCDTSSSSIRRSLRWRA
jgi:transposase